MQTNFNIPTALTLSVIPDADILIPFLEHRGPTHSIIAAFIVFLPIFAVYRKKTIPYFIALIQHSLIGDLISGSRIQILWPISAQYYEATVSINSQTNIAIEWTVFLITIVVLLSTGDKFVLFQPRSSNLILSIPTFTVLLPTFIRYPLDVPTWLIPPHLVYILIFSASIVIDLSKILKKTSPILPRKR